MGAEDEPLPRVGLALLTLLPGRVGGSETYVRGLLGALAGESDAALRLTVLANGPVAARYASCARGPVELARVRSYRPGRGDLERLLAMTAARLAPRSVARDVPRDLALLHHPLTVPIPAPAGVPRVTTLHDVLHHELPGTIGPAERRYRRWAYDDAARGAAAVITPTEHARRAAIARLGLDPARVTAIAHGIDHARFTPRADDADASALRGLPPRFLLYPSNLWPHKNHATLIDALASMADREVALVLTGQSYGRLDALLRHARQRGVAARVQHRGHVPGHALAALYRRAAGVVFPSRFEGFGSPPLEAMACACPTAVSDIGALDEVCGDAALRFDPGDPAAIAAAADRLLADDELRRRLRDAGLRRAAQRTWRASARAHLDLYSATLASVER